MTHFFRTRKRKIGNKCLYNLFIKKRKYFGHRFISGVLKLLSVPEKSLQKRQKVKEPENARGGINDSGNFKWFNVILDSKADFKTQFFVTDLIQAFWAFFYLCQKGTSFVGFIY